MREIMGYDKHPELRARAKAKAEAYRRRKDAGEFLTAVRGAV